MLPDWFDETKESNTPSQPKSNFPLANKSIDELIKMVKEK